MIRKIFCTATLVCVMLLSNAQSEKIATETSGMFLRDNQVMYAKRGYVTNLKTDQTLSNGSKLTTQGKIIGVDGSVTNFEPGILYSFEGEKTGIVTEYVTLKNATCVLMTNEILTVIDGFKFGNGETIDKAGILSSGVALKEGEKISLSGERIK